MRSITLTVFLLIGFFAKAQIDDAKLLDFIETQRYAELANYIESIYPNGNEDSKMVSRLAYAYYMSGNLLKAENNYLKLLQKDSLSFSTLNSLANIANKRGNYPHMVNYYQKILNIDSANFYIIKQTAFAYQQMDNEDKEFEYLKKASRINSTDPEVAYDFSRRLMYMIKLKEADSVLNMALAADSSNMLLLKGSLSINYSSDNFNEAVRRGETLMNLGDSSNETKNKLAQSYYYTNQFQKCISLMEQIIKSDAANETTFYFIGLSYRRLKNLDKSNESLNAAIEAGISNNLGIYYQELGKNREELNQFSSSIYNYKKALEFNNKLNIVNYSIARIYDAKLKKTKTALGFYKQYVKNADKKSKYDRPFIEYSTSRIQELSSSK
ncbi:hypothetical protein A5893_03500 [Pedobacter psychrophilus]|uniref:Uncharacterized protein n=1 Tax=Pedobacter psychrophilus TaxID=1826909 RepID=A0A179DN26_9SPHI|nr:hypothetical protein [Pedobacter psychrophilus]OAQ42192.1 hypothetical protein A5893_03500 [Pedobacter psychrophilus]